MITLLLIEPLKIKTFDQLKTFNKGDIITARRIDPFVKLIEAGKIIPAQPCGICNSLAWWLSVHGSLVCSVCHPPVASKVKT